MSIKHIKILVFVLALLPLAWLVRAALTGGLGANPVEEITFTTGDWALRFLLLTLAITPLRQLTGWNRLIQLRRMLGLYAFFYASLHLSTYLVFDQFFDWRAIVEDVLKRPYITLGVSCFLLLLPLAVTSTNGWIRRLGKRWRLLHRLVYPASLLAVTHYLWLVKADYREPLIYSGIALGLLGFRLLPGSLRRLPALRIKRPLARAGTVRQSA